MAQHTLKVKSVNPATHDVLHIRTSRPGNHQFEPGQATEVAINKPDWKEERRPFTFTSLPEDDYLEFTIKTYPDHNGVTNELLNLQAGDELLIGDSWGSIQYKGPGTFIAGGAGVTPFISILRHLHAKDEIAGNILIFANKTRADIINQKEFEDMLGPGFINILSDEKSSRYTYGKITADYLKKLEIPTDKYFYVCGPPPMMEAVEEHLATLGVKEDQIVKEEF